MLMDFTVMGLGGQSHLQADQSLNARTGEVCLVSERFAQLTTQATRAVGSFDLLKGISEAQRVYASVECEGARKFFEHSRGNSLADGTNLT